MCSLASKLRETLDRQVYETSDDHLSPKHWTIHHSQIEAEQSSSMNDHMQSSSKSDKCDQYTLLHSSLARILISDQTNRTKTKTTEHRKSLTIRTNDSLESSGRQSNLQADRRQLIERTWIGQRALQRVRTWTEQRPATVLLLLCVAGSTCLVVRNQWQTIHSRSSTTSTTEYVDTIDSNHQATTVEQLSEFDQALTVRSDCGWLVGNVEQGAFVFKGIEYGVADRWKEPIPIWNHSQFCQPEKVHRAAQFGDVCAQIHPLKGKTHGAERCLYLNVWTPRLDLTAHLPVLVWLHAGFVQFGSGHEHYQRASGLLARKLNAVIVSVNFRLDALAFATNQNLALSDQLVALDWVQRNIVKFGGSPDRVTLAGADGGAACALALFTSGHLQRRVSRLWLTGPAVYHDHHHQANHNSPTHDDPLEIANWIAGESQLQVPQVLRSFLGASGEPSFRVNDQNDLPIQGIFTPQWIKVDGRLVQEAYPFNGTRLLNTTPLLIGSAMHAIEYWPGPRDLVNWTWPEYIKYVVTSLDSFSTHTSATALQLYPPAHASGADERRPTNSSVSKYKLKESAIDFSLDHSNSLQSNTQFKRLIKRPNDLTQTSSDDKLLRRQRQTNKLGDETESDRKHATHRQLNADELYATMVSDIRQTCPVNEMAANLARHHSAPIYRYVVSAKPSKPVQLYDYASRNSFHLFETIAFFDRLSHLIDSPTEADLLFAQRVQQMVADFVHAPLDSLLQPQPAEQHRQPDRAVHPHPKLGEDGLWPRYPNAIALLDRELTLVNSYASGRCAFWTQQALDRYAWIC